MPDIVDSDVAIRLDKDAVKQDADIFVVARELGLNLIPRGNKYLMLCPCHDDHHVGSCYLTEKGFKCYACGKGGDLFFLVQAVANVSFSEAVKIVADINGGYKKYVIEQEELAAQYDEVRFINYADREFIGLYSVPVYKTIGITYDYDNLPDLKEHGYILETADRDDGRFYGYIIKECVDSNPLYTLYKEDFNAYQQIIDNRCAETVRRYERNISWLSNPSGIPKYQSVLHNLISLVPLSEWIVEISKPIQRAKQISAKYGNGISITGMYYDTENKHGTMINHAAIAVANGIWHEKTGVPF